MATAPQGRPMSEAQTDSPPAEAVPEPPRTSRLARASLWFGIIGFVVAIFPAAVVAGILIESSTRPLPGIVGAMATQLLAFLPAVAFGWLGLRRIGRSGGTLRGRGSAVAGIVMGFLGLAVAGLWTHAVIGAQEVGNRALCQGNLKQLGSILGSYAYLHEDRFPESLSALHEEMPWDLRLFVCPSVGGEPPSPDRIDEEGSYVYAGAGHKLTGVYDRDVSTIPIMWDKPGNHGGEGVNVLYMSGYVHWQEEAPTPVAPPEPAAGAAGHSAAK